MALAPICVFVYNRPEETKRMLDALRQNEGCGDSVLYVFADGPKKETDREKVEEVRRLTDSIEGFKRVEKRYSLKNKGLAKSIIEGITEVLKEHESVIVLEDDLVTSKDFLVFMNSALEAYKERKDIWNISGYTPPIAIPEHYEKDVFIVPRPQCWGWATWRDRWENIDWDVTEYGRLKNRSVRRDFDRGGNDLTRTLDMERHGKIESWAIRWCYAAFLQGAWCVNPRESKVQNIGFELTGSHQGWHDARHCVNLSGKNIIIDPYVQPDEEICKAFKAHHDLGLVSKVGYFMRRYDLGYKTMKRILNGK